MDTRASTPRRWRLWLTVAFCPLVLGAACAASALVMVCMTRFEGRTLAAASILAAGVAVAGFGAGALLRATRPGRAAAVVGLCWLLTSGLGISMLSKRVTWSAAGMTVYGLMPIPVFDVVIQADGRLRLRDKKGVAPREIASLVEGEDVDVVLIGTGYKHRLGVDPLVRELAPDVRLLPTSRAFAAYNRLRGSGLRVVLLAHTT